MTRLLLPLGVLPALAAPAAARAPSFSLSLTPATPGKPARECGGTWSATLVIARTDGSETPQALDASCTS